MVCFTREGGVEMKKHPCHSENLVALKRIEGQIRGIQKMIEDRRYCIDILTQLRSVVKAIDSVKRKIYRRHLENCVTEAIEAKSESEIREKIDEVINLLSKS